MLSLLWINHVTPVGISQQYNLVLKDSSQNHLRYFYSPHIYSIDDFAVTLAEAATWTLKIIPLWVKLPTAVEQTWEKPRFIAHFALPMHSSITLPERGGHGRAVLDGGEKTVYLHRLRLGIQSGF